MKNKKCTSRRNFIKTTAAGTTGLMVSGIVKKSIAKGCSWYPGKQLNRAVLNERVVCCHDEEIVKQGSTFGTTFSSQNEAIDTDRVHADLDEMAQKLTLIDDVAEAWKAIFQKPANKEWSEVNVAFKVNCIHTQIMNHIAIIDKICQVLNGIDSPGVPYSNMIVFDGCHNADGSSKYTPYIGNGLPSGVIVSNRNGSLGGMTQTSIPDTSTQYDCTTHISDGTIDILINCAVNKGHGSTYGTCTLTMKNHFGTFDPTHDLNYLLRINKSDAIIGGTPTRQQLCIMDSICSAVSGPTASITHMPHRLIMGIFGPAVDFFTVKKVREPIMNASHNSSVVNQLLSYFGYSSSEIDDLLNLSPDQNNGKGWLEFEPGQTNINSNSSSLSKKQTITFKTGGNNFKAITKRFSLKQGERIKNALIVNMKGRLIQNLSGSLNSKGENILTWNARTKQGREVSAGTYILKIVGTKTEKTLKFMLQK